MNIKGNKKRVTYKMKKFFIFLLSSLLVLAACGKNYEICDITNKFKKEGLSVEN